MCAVGSHGANNLRVAPPFPAGRALWDTGLHADPCLLPTMEPTDYPPNTSVESPGKIETPLTREALYALVWAEPMLKVAASFDVSASYMARVCTRMNVPRPERGYWAKHAVGKAPPQDPLPEARPGDELSWSREGDKVLVPRPLPKPPSEIKRRRRRPAAGPKQHPLLAGAKELFEAAGRVSFSGDYLKPSKRLLLDLAVTKSGLDKALSFANALFLRLEESGHRVVIAPNGEHLNRAAVDERENPSRTHHYNNLWSPGRITVVYIGTVAIGLTIIEMSEELEARNVNGIYVPVRNHGLPKRTKGIFDSNWTLTHDFPTGRLCLQAYSPYYGAEWKKQWRETNSAPLDNKISAVVTELEEVSAEIARMVEEERKRADADRRRRDAEWEEYKRQEEEREAAEALRESGDELIKIIERWAESKRIEQFFAEVEQDMAELDGSTRAQLLDRLRSARELIGGTDALAQFMAWKLPAER